MRGGVFRSESSLKANFAQTKIYLLFIHSISQISMFPKTNPPNALTYNLAHMPKEKQNQSVLAKRPRKYLHAPTFSLPSYSHSKPFIVHHIELKGKVKQEGCSKGEGDRGEGRRGTKEDEGDFKDAAEKPRSKTEFGMSQTESGDSGNGEQERAKPERASSTGCTMSRDDAGMESRGRDRWNCLAFRLHSRRGLASLGVAIGPGICVGTYLVYGK